MWKYSFSGEFLEKVQNTNNLEIVDKLLRTFNESLVDFYVQGNSYFVQFNKFGVKGSPTSYNINVDVQYYYETSKIKTNATEVAMKIIRDCDLHWNDVHKSNNFEDDVVISFEKHALKDFLDVVVLDNLKKHHPIKDMQKYSIVLDPTDANLYIDSRFIPKDLILNGVFTSEVLKGIHLHVKIEKDNFEPIETVIVPNETSNVFNFTLTPKKSVLTVAMCEEGSLKLFKTPIDLQLRDVKKSGLTDIIKPNSGIDETEVIPDSLIDFTKKGDMYYAEIENGVRYTLIAEKRLFKTQKFEFIGAENVSKVIKFEPYYVQCNIDLDERFKDAEVKINGVVTKMPYTKELEIGEYLKIEATSADGFEYKNFVIANEADIENGLNFLISFTKVFKVILSTTAPNSELYVNSLNVTDYFEADFVEGSIIDVRLISTDQKYYDVTDRFMVTSPVTKEYELTELRPTNTVTISCTPEDATVTLNGKPILNPFEGEFPDGASLKLMCTKLGYKTYLEEILVNTDINKIVNLEALPKAKPKLNLSCNVKGAKCIFNGSDKPELDFPIELTVEPNSSVDISVYAEGYVTFDQVIDILEDDVDLEINLEKIPTPETDMVELALVVDKPNALVMVNSHQLDIDQGKYKILLPRGTYALIQITHPYSEVYKKSIILDDSVELNVHLEDKDAPIYRLNVFVKNPGAILKIDGFVESAPFMRDYSIQKELDIECYLEGYQTFKETVIMDEDRIVDITLKKLEILPDVHIMDFK